MPLLHMNFHSHALGMACSCDILLPDTVQYPNAQERKNYPVLYLLHGLSDDHTIWQRRTRIESYVTGKDLIVVMPNVHRSFYTNTVSGHKYFDFVAEELPAICKAYFPVSDKREDTFVAGLSMGGYGALKLALTYPDRYAAVASLSGVTLITDRLIREVTPARSNEFLHVFGPVEEVAGSGNDLTALADRIIAEKIRKPAVFMACGESDFLLQDNRIFRERYGEAFNINYMEAPGNHNWDFWDTHIQKVLAWLPLPCNQE